MAYGFLATDSGESRAGPQYPFAPASRTTPFRLLFASQVNNCGRCQQRVQQAVPGGPYIWAARVGGRIHCDGHYWIHVSENHEGSLATAGTLEQKISRFESEFPDFCNIRLRARFVIQGSQHPAAVK